MAPERAEHVVGALPASPTPPACAASVRRGEAGVEQGTSRRRVSDGSRVSMRRWMRIGALRMELFSNGACKHGGGRTSRRSSVASYKKPCGSALSDTSGAARAIRSVSKERVRSAPEAELVVRVLRLFPLSPRTGEDDRIGSPLHDVVAWLQSVEDDKARAVFERFGAPELVRIFDDAESGLREGEDTFRMKSDLLFLLKVVCTYAPAGGLEPVHRAARSPLLRDEYLWSVLFNLVATEGHPWQAGIVDAMREPLRKDSRASHTWTWPTASLAKRISNTTPSTVRRESHC